MLFRDSLDNTSNQYLKVAVTLRGTSKLCIRLHVSTKSVS